MTLKSIISNFATVNHIQIEGENLAIYRILPMTRFCNTSFIKVLGAAAVISRGSDLEIKYRLLLSYPMEFAKAAGVLSWYSRRNIKQLQAALLYCKVITAQHFQYQLLLSTHRKKVANQFCIELNSQSVKLSFLNARLVQL